MRTIAIISLMVVVILLAEHSTATDHTYIYTYSDDFTTNKVESDSYDHSPISHFQGPWMHFAGILVLWPMMVRNGLAFEGGYDPGFSAHLSYRFPLGPSSGVISSGSISLFLESGPTVYRPFIVRVSSDSISWSSVASISSPGQYNISLPVSSVDLHVWVSFVSEMALLDDFTIQLLISEPDFICGDVNGDGSEVVDIADLVYLINYMFRDGPPPPNMNTADVNGSGGPIDISDLVFMIDYMFLGGPPPVECP